MSIDTSGKWNSNNNNNSNNNTLTVGSAPAGTGSLSSSTPLTSSSSSSATTTPPSPSASLLKSKTWDIDIQHFAMKKRNEITLLHPRKTFELLVESIQQKDPKTLKKLLNKKKLVTHIMYV